jgi:predicted DNA-binding transcriptional regulator YafY
MTQSDLDATRARILTLHELLQAAAVFPGHIGMERLKQALNERLGLGEFDRRTLYRDIFLLNAVSNLEITYDQRLKAYTAARRCRLSKAELSILINAVLSARFDSHGETEAMANKLYQMAGNEKMPTGLHSLENRVKLGQDGDTLAKLDLLREAIEDNKQVSFDYRKYNTRKELVTMRFGCRVSPYKVLWQNDRMYLVGHFAGSSFSHYRIERICELRVTKDPRASVGGIIGYGQRFDEAEYLRRAVGLSSGQMTRVAIRFQNSMAGEVLDSLGREANIHDNQDGTFTLCDEVLLNKKFTRWLLGFGAAAEVLQPKALRREVVGVFGEALGVYGIG